ncbi:MAG: MiaB/RimO family radical SAM methylthiotransferase [Candidatus Omnitrophica bacterium]|nr:MiaB/RimO family radical SAM methylthiotransferase [Candidatus Omnitrophota bacterium]MDD5356463.1 MiaB/RimO family radical SAM methylthiotransferase [Candidatus Omnitrophota bacterium]
MSLRIGIVSLGCPRNLVDSETILSRLKNKNFSVGRLEDAEVVFVNTCAFIKEAKEESIGTILSLIDLKKQGVIKKLIVCGCLVERYKDELVRNLDGIDAFVGRLDLNAEFTARHLLTPKHFAYVKISEGCGNFCSYCVIPRIKGKLNSRPVESIIDEVRTLDRNNTKEINLVGQDITLYGADSYGRPMLHKLIKEILKNTKNIKWLRLLYLNPKRIDDRLIDLISKEERICKYVDMPVQHINDRILKLMNRNIAGSEIVSLIRKIRSKIKGVYLRTSVIVGFPTETQKDFQGLMDFLRKVKFERLGAFIYSREEGTAAYAFKKQIHYRRKKSRFDKLMLLQQDIAREINKSLLGREVQVMVDEKDSEDKNIYLARLEQDAPEVDGVVYVKSKKNLRPGEFLKVKITDTLEYDLTGEPA